MRPNSGCTRGLLAAVLILTGIVMVVAVPRAAHAAAIYDQHNLVSDIAGLADNQDPNLVNPWGVSFSPTSPFWVSDQAKNVATIYRGNGQPAPLVVSIPQGGPPSGPTGQVFNSTAGFLVNGTPASFIFATLQGTIDAWNGSAGTTAAVMVHNEAFHAVYTGLAMGATPSSGTFLYAANFSQGTIDVFNSTFAPTSLPGSFTDPALPNGYAPHNIQNVGGKLYAEYDAVDPVTHRPVIGPAGKGTGVVDVFDTSGNFLQRLVSNGPLSALNSPWGIALAPGQFGAFSNDLLVGNFGDGTINAFDPATGAFLGTLEDSHGQPIQNDRLWALAFGNGGPGFDPNTLYITAGIDAETHGLFASIAPAPVPEPATSLLLVTGGVLSLTARAFRRRSCQRPSPRRP